MREAQHTEPDEKIPMDNGGRRLGEERRHYTYYGYLPERRSGDERRSGSDRREKPRLT